MSSASDPFKKIKFETLDNTIQDLLRQAALSRNNAYCPYSNFKVGACVLCKNGNIYTGCNVENATHISICAERTAYVKAISEGHKQFKAVAVVADAIANTITSPCGTCRQFLSEFGEVTVYMGTPNFDQVFVSTLGYLLPHQFRLIHEKLIGQ